MTIEELEYNPDLDDNHITYDDLDLATLKGMPVDATGSIERHGNTDQV